MMKIRRFALVLAVFLALIVPAQAAGEVRVAFLDSGISTRHLDPAHVMAGENFVFPERGTDDRIGHGTAVAGLVLGSKELHLKGLCPEAVAVPLVCMDRYPSGVLTSAGEDVLARGIRTAVEEYGCRVVNVSMGVTADSAALREAAAFAEKRGAVVVAAVGNANRTDPASVYYPAAYDTVIGVGAADGSAAADFSQRHGVDVLAPGVALKTVPNRSTKTPDTRSGTSFACAYVSGLCAEIVRQHPEYSAAQVRQALFATAQDVGTPGFDADSGWGLVTAPMDKKTAERLTQSVAVGGAMVCIFMR